jgi:hypothetical protein
MEVTHCRGTLLEELADWQHSTLLLRPPDHTGQSEQAKARVRRSPNTEVHIGVYHLLEAEFVEKKSRRALRQHRTVFPPLWLPRSHVVKAGSQYPSLDTAGLRRLKQDLLQ